MRYIEPLILILLVLTPALTSQAQGGWIKVKAIVHVKHADDTPVPDADVYITLGSFGYSGSTNQYGVAVFYVDVPRGYIDIESSKVYDIAGTKITYYAKESIYVSGDVEVTLTLMPQNGCFLLRSFQLSKTILQPRETVSGYAEWVFAKCCPSCYVYVVVYDQSGREVVREQGEDFGYTHKVVYKNFLFEAPSSLGTYCLTLNVAYAHTPPEPSQGIIGRTCFTVTAPSSPVNQPSDTIQLLTFFILLVIATVAASILLRRRTETEKEERILKALLSD
jgi:hypothetical protein